MRVHEVAPAAERLRADDRGGGRPRRERGRRGVDRGARLRGAELRDGDERLPRRGIDHVERRAAAVAKLGARPRVRDEALVAEERRVRDADARRERGARVRRRRGRRGGRRHRASGRESGRRASSLVIRRDESAEWTTAEGRLRIAPGGDGGGERDAGVNATRRTVEGSRSRRSISRRRGGASSRGAVCRRRPRGGGEVSRASFVEIASSLGFHARRDATLRLPRRRASSVDRAFSRGGSRASRVSHARARRTSRADRRTSPRRSIDEDGEDQRASPNARRARIPRRPPRVASSSPVHHREKTPSRIPTRDPPSHAPAPPRPAPPPRQDPTEKEEEEKKDWTHAYAEDLRADIYTEVNPSPKATVHQREWRKILNGDPGRESTPPSARGSR